MTFTPARTRLLLVVVYAVGMAWVESACVYYLRTIVGGIDPSRAIPVTIPDTLGPAELVREAATLVMLLAIGGLAGHTVRSRIAYLAIAFGVWDVFYYVFLKVMTGWPASLFDWDLLFLLPLPWWGPVIAPVSIALLMIAWGVIDTQSASITDAPPTSPLWPLTGAGIALALYVFMADALAVLSRGGDLTTVVAPSSFNWVAFILALGLMGAPVADLARHLRSEVRQA